MALRLDNFVKLIVLHSRKCKTILESSFEKFLSAGLPRLEEIIRRIVVFFVARERAFLSFFCFVFLYAFLRLASSVPFDNSRRPIEIERSLAKGEPSLRVIEKKQRDQPVNKISDPQASMKSMKSKKPLSPISSTNIPAPKNFLFLKEAKEKRKQRESKRKVKKLPQKLRSPLESKIESKIESKMKMDAHARKIEKQEESIYVAFTDEEGSTFAKHIPLLQEIRKEREAEAKLHKKKVKQALVHKKYDLAWQRLHELRNYAPKDIEINYLEGEAYLGQKKWRLAKEHFQSYLLSHPEHAMTHFRLGQIYYKEGLYANAAEHYKTAIKIKPKFYTAHLNLAVNLLEQEKYDEAATRLQKIVKAKPKMWKAAYYLSRAYAKSAKHSQGIKLLNKYLASNPQKSLLYQAKGQILYEMGDFAAAAQSFRKALKRQASYTNWLLLGGALYAQKSYRQSLKALLEAKKIYSTDPKLHYRVSKLYLKLKQEKAALESLETSLSIDPGYKEALIDSLDLYKRLNFIPKAFAKLEGRLPHVEERSENYDFYIEVGDFYRQHKKYAVAQEIYRRAIRSDPQKPKAYLRMVRTFRRLRAYREVELTYQELLQNIPDYAEGHRLLGLLYHKDMRLPQKAKQYLEKYLSMKPDARDTNEIHDILRSP